MMIDGSLRRILFALLVGGSLSLFAPARAADRYTLVLEDGRRIDVASYEESGDWLYYDRYDARIGVARAKVKEIITHSPNHETVPLEEEIVGRVYRSHQLRFALSDFLRADYLAAEIEPRLTPEEQQAYVRKLLRMKTIEIFEIDDSRHAAETNGDVVELAAQEHRLIAALTAWGEGQAALASLAQRHRLPVRPDDGPAAIPASKDETDTMAGHETVDTETPPAPVPGEDAPVLRNGLEKLQHRREMLLLIVKKNYRAHGRTGGFLALQAAEQNLRIVDLQIRYFDRLPVVATSSPGPIRSGP